jgi:phage terminase small subunit
VKTNPGKTLTPKQDRFILEYLIDLNATAAAIRAGYAERSAKRIGYEILQKPEVKRALAAARKKLAAKLELSAEKVLGDIARIAAKAERAKEFHAALKGHEMLGKHLKLFTEKHEHGGIGGGPVVLQITSADEDL